MDFTCFFLRVDAPAPPLLPFRTCSLANLLSEQTQECLVEDLCAKSYASPHTEQSSCKTLMVNTACFSHVLTWMYPVPCDMPFSLSENL